MHEAINRFIFLFFVVHFIGDACECGEAVTSTLNHTSGSRANGTHVSRARAVML
ncbi:hypothetical protein GLYMA_06G008950v4 [Glycine max]|nr:hypothetical protein GLYMA_06G008950v4 [Glycine max]KAH1123602.1 hypothetical protein GYH30_013710 [Glycine max]